MKYILVALFILSSSISAEDKLSSSQLNVLNKVYTKAKPFDLQLTMSAIAWQESHLGKYKVNLSDPSFGVFHNNIATVSNRHNIKGQWSKSRIAERLIEDFDFSFAEALAELQYWKSYYKGKPRPLSKAIMSYNCGFNIKRKACKVYLRSIKTRMNIVKSMFHQHKSRSTTHVNQSK